MVSSARSSVQKKKSSTGNDTNWQRYYYSPIAPCSPVAPRNEGVLDQATQVNAEGDHVTELNQDTDSSSGIDTSRGISQVIRVNADSDQATELHRDTDSSSGGVDHSSSRGIPNVPRAPPLLGPCSNNGSSGYPRRPYPGFHPNHLVIPVGNGVPYNNNGVGGQYRPNFVGNNMVPRGPFPLPYTRGMNEPPPLASARPMPFTYRSHVSPYGGFRPDMRAPPPPAYPHYRYCPPAPRPPHPYGGLPDYRPYPGRYAPPPPRYH